MDQYLKTKLLQDVEGSCTGQFGYIVCVMDGMRIDVGRGRVIPGNGSAEFDVKYRAIVWRPFKVRFNQFVRAGKRAIGVTRHND